MLARPRASIPGLANPEAAKAAEDSARAAKTVQSTQARSDHARPGARGRPPALGQCVFLLLRNARYQERPCVRLRARRSRGLPHRMAAARAPPRHGPRSRPGARVDGAGACAGGRAASAPRRGCLSYGEAAAAAAEADAEAVAMAPFPDEVDVFTAPHWRMKQLVGRYCDKVKERGAEGGAGERAGSGRPGLRACRNPRAGAARAFACAPSPARLPNLATGVPGARAGRSLGRALAGLTRAGVRGAPGRPGRPPTGFPVRVRRPLLRLLAATALLARPLRALQVSLQTLHPLWTS